MSVQRDLDERTVDALAALARDATPPPMSSERRDAQIAVAMQEVAMQEAGRAPARTAPSRWGSARYAIAAAALVLLGIVGAREWAIERATVRGAGELVLPTGDRLLTTPSATLRFEDLTAASRRIDLYHGEALFDVQPLAPGQVFLVRAAELEVEVRGTVFAVELTEDDAIVRVYEGHVDVRAHGAVVASLGAGEAFTARHGARSGVDDGAFAAEGRRAAEARGARLSASADVPPEPASVPATDSLVPTTLRAEAPVVQGEASPTAIEPSRARPEPRREAAAGTAPTLPRDAPIETSDVVALIAGRRFDEALDAARRGAAQSGHWRFRMLEAQALEGLGRSAEAADALDVLARSTAGDARAEAAYRAASVRWRELSDPRGAVRSLDASSFDGTAFEERALGLRARALEAAGQHAEAARAAARYLERYPEGGLVAEMRTLAE